MYVVFSDQVAPTCATITDWLVGFGRTIRQHYSGWAAQRRERAFAQALYYATDVELRDMGITRGDIPAVVSRSYRRD